jgi:hypothetical protein
MAATWAPLLGTLFEPCRLAYLTYTSNDCLETPLTMNFLKSQWIRAYGGAMPCCNNPEKIESWKNKRENRKMCEKREMYMKNNGTYFNLNNCIFCTTVYSSFVPLIKGKVQQLFLELDLTIIFH